MIYGYLNTLQGYDGCFFTKITHMVYGYLNTLQGYILLKSSRGLLFFHRAVIRMSWKQESDRWVISCVRLFKHRFA